MGQAARYHAVSISIHPMWRFRFKKHSGGEFWREFQYIQCGGSATETDPNVTDVSYFNTSNVEVPLYVKNLSGA